MSSSVKPIPEGYHTVTPYIVADGASRLLEFLEAAFDAKVLYRSLRENGEIGHAEIQIGDSRLMLSGTQPQWPALQCAIYLYVEDCDAMYAKAIAAGAKSTMEPANQFYGDRNAGVKDAEGNTWWIATHIEDVSPEEVSRRAAAHGKG